MEMRNEIARQPYSPEQQYAQQPQAPYPPQMAPSPYGGGGGPYPPFAPLPPAPEAPRTKKGLPMWAYIAGGVVALVLVLGTIFVISWVRYSGQVDAYNQVIKGDGTTVDDDLTAVSTVCQSGDAQGCRAAVVKTQNDVHTEQKDLDAHPAPACAKSADGHLRSALSLLDSATTLFIRGIDDNSVDEVNQGNDKLTAAESELSQFHAALKAAQC